MSYIHQPGGAPWPLLRPPTTFLPTRHRRPPGPPDDAPMLALLAPLSGMDPDATPVANPLGNYTRPRRHAPIDGPRAKRLHADGFSVVDIADILRATTRAVERVLADERRGYRGFKR